MERLDGSIRGALRDAGVPDAGALAEITSCWQEVVGDAIARAAWPLRIARDGTLHVAAASSSWAFELGLLGEEILGKLSAAVGADAPTAIRFVPGPVPSPTAPASRPSEPVAIDPDARRLADELTVGMSDEELRETIARAAAASLSKRPSDRRFW